MSGNLHRLGLEVPDWHAQGPCRARPALNWYSDTPREIAAVKAVCWEECPVRGTCLQDALDRREPWGVWGGLDPKERTEYARQLGAQVPTIARHGERARYVGTKNVPGCRCDLCKRAHADYEHRRRIKVSTRGPSWTPPTKPCDGCGQQFAGRTANQRFCGPECKTLWEKKQVEARRQARLSRRCVQCEGPMALTRQRYCSDECAKGKSRQGPTALQLAS